MFRVVEKFGFAVPVEVVLPDGEKQPFEARFSVGSEDLEELQDPAAIDAALARVWTGWSGVVDENGEEVPFDEATRDRLLLFPFVRVAIIRALAAALGGSRGN